MNIRRKRVPAKNGQRTKQVNNKRVTTLKSGEERTTKIKIRNENENENEKGGVHRITRVLLRKDTVQ